MNMNSSERIFKRLVVAASNSYLYTRDGINYLPYYLPRSFEHLSTFLHTGYKRYPDRLYRKIDF